MLKSLHITIKSVRQAFDCIQGAIPLFLQRHLHFNPMPFDKGSVVEFWAALGVSESWQQRLADVNPWWHQDKLQVSVDFVNDGAALDEIHDLIVYMLKLKDYTESR